MVNKIDFQLLSFGMRRIGWIRFWIQSILSVVVTAVLLFSNFVSNDSEGQLGLAPGLSLTSISLILLFICVECQECFAVVYAKSSYNRRDK